MLACLARGSLQDILQEGFTEQQLKAYVAWVNSQLKKKPDVKPIHDLRQDLRDGVVLAHLIEIVAGERLNGIQGSPGSAQEMRENVEKVLQFVASKKIRMHQTSSKDIVDGNLKSLLRLILALAAHFKPGSGRAGSQSEVGLMGKTQNSTTARHRPHSAMAMAQEAVTALADARQDMTMSGRDVFRHTQRSSSMDDDIENPYWSVRAMVQQFEGHPDGPQSPTSLSSLTSSSPAHSGKTESVTTQPEKRGDFGASPAEEVDFELDESDSIFLPDWKSDSPASPAPARETSWEKQHVERHDELEGEVKEMKNSLFELQSLLLSGRLPGEEQVGSVALTEEGANVEDLLVIVRSRLDQSMEENRHLKKELQKSKEEARNLQGIKDALQQRMAQQESSVLQLKQELLRANLDKDELRSQNDEMQRKLDERSSLLGEYKKEIGQNERLIQQLQAKLDEATKKLSESSRHKTDFEKVLDHKGLLLRHLMNREQDQVLGYNSHSTHSNGILRKAPAAGSTAPRVINDLQLVRDSLRSLRNGLSGQDPQHHTIDSLEQGIASLMERLHAIEAQRRQDKRARARSPGNRTASEYRDSWPPNSKMPHSRSTPAVSGGACTKVLYFTDRSLTPFMVNIAKRLGDVTLSDFKAAIDRDGTYRYHFKALDPEFGTVKEEVFHDDDIIPGWEGKIVAWVEEDHGDLK